MTHFVDAHDVGAPRQHGGRISPQRLARRLAKIAPRQPNIGQHPIVSLAELGLKLFSRERQRLVITQAGRAYLAVLRDAFDRIADGTQQLLQRQSGGGLTVSTSPNFTAKWLVHRLGRFAEAHPEIDLRVSASLHHVDFAREDIDLAIRHGDGTAPGLHVTRLCAEGLFPVCSPKLLNGRNPLRKPTDLGRFTLLLILPALPAWTRHAAPFSTRQAWRSMQRLTARG